MLTLGTDSVWLSVLACFLTLKLLGVNLKVTEIKGISWFVCVHTRVCVPAGIFTYVWVHMCEHQRPTSSVSLQSVISTPCLASYMGSGDPTWVLMLEWQAPDMIHVPVPTSSFSTVRTSTVPGPRSLTAQLLASFLLSFISFWIIFPAPKTKTNNLTKHE